MTKKIQTAAFGVPEYEMKWEGTYRPRISSEHLRRLWRLKHRTKKPITKLVAEALDYYFENAIDEDGRPVCINSIRNGQEVRTND